VPHYTILGLHYCNTEILKVVLKIDIVCWEMIPSDAAYKLDYIKTGLILLADISYAVRPI
jgi:hypothetical protein